MILVFGTTINLYKMTSNEEVLYMKKLGIFDVNDFVVRAMIIWFHLKGRNYVWSNKTLAFGALFFQLGLQDILKWENVLHGAASVRRTGRFWYLKRPNPSSYKKVMVETVCCCKASQRASQESLDVRRKTEIRRERSVHLRFLPDFRRELDVRRVRRSNDDGRPNLATGVGKTFQIRVFSDLS